MVRSLKYFLCLMVRGDRCFGIFLRVEEHTGTRPENAQIQCVRSSSGSAIKYNILVGFRMGSRETCRPVHTLNLNTLLAISRNKAKCFLLANLHQLADMLHSHGLRLGCMFRNIQWWRQTGSCSRLQPVSTVYEVSFQLKTSYMQCNFQLKFHFTIHRRLCK